MKKALLILRDILILALAVLLILVTVRIIKAQDYYHADETAEAYMTGDNSVSVEPSLIGTLFDGPGTDNVLVFYPAKGVDAKAYAPLLHDLAAGGLDCLVVQMPLKDPSLWNWAAAVFMTEYRYENWYIGGHGEGAQAAGIYAAKNEESFCGLICFGGFAKESLQQVSFDVLMLYGSNDRIFDKSLYQQNAPYLSVEKVIEGGNFAQFGNFGPYGDEELSDGTASITWEAQQKEAIDFILNFVGPSEPQE